MNNSEMIQSSLAISDGFIREINDLNILKAKYSGAKIIDIQGQTVFPGFIDSHAHLMRTGFLKIHLDLSGAQSINEIKEKIKTEAESKRNGDWIVGLSLDETRLKENRYPTKRELDEIAPHHPVVLIRTCTHLLVVNSKALALANIDKNTHPPAGGEIERDHRSEPTGILKRTAGNLMFSMINSDFTMNKKAIKAGINYFKENGITTVHSMAINVKDPEHYFNITKAIKEALQEENYPLRIIEGAEIEILNALISKNINFLEGDDYFKQGYIKFYTDGSLGTRTALMSEPYSDDPANCGIESITKESLYHYVKLADEHGYQCAIHALGDQGLMNALEVLGQVIQTPDNPLRHRIVHAGVVSEQLLKRLAQYNIPVDIQPNFLASDVKWLEKALGKRSDYVYAWQSMLNSGITMAASSDSPVEPIFPFYGIRAAVKRQDLSNYPEGGFKPWENVSLKSMIDMYTINGAYEYFEEDKKGTISEGKFADLVVLSKNPFDTNPDDLINISNLMTIVGGQPVYKTETF